MSVQQRQQSRKKEGKFTDLCSVGYYCSSISYSSVTEQCQTLTTGRSAHRNKYIVFKGICSSLVQTHLRVSCDLYNFLSKSCHQFCCLFESHEVELIEILVKHPIQGRKNVTRVGLEPRSCNQSHRKNHVFALLAMLLTSPKAVIEIRLVAIPFYELPSVILVVYIL